MVQQSSPELAFRILLVEDDAEIAAMLAETLNESGYRAFVAGSGLELDKMLHLHNFDLIVLDAMLPGEDGFSICRRLRTKFTTPIIMLTALADDIDRIIGLELGADDYVTKPFNTRELMARIRAQLRRAAYGWGTRAQQDIVIFAGWRLDVLGRHLQDPGGVRVSLTSAEFEILHAFCQNAGRVLSREQLLAMTHAGLAGPVERSVDVHISRVRQKIEINPREPAFIKTVRLGGYIFTPIVERL
ncbi:response regulator [Kaistia terrae]|uniref:Response regulator n=1 Tax=Kaistia terrae TaxID=537017 RepID=A0ABW0PYT5_9HYPH|nr:response regulator transcription factor [Kaistia terrae]MCX5581684.1 response regulator transcription factor [Kaistia terrae]